VIDTIQPFPILEFDSTARAIFEPDSLHQAMDVPEHCVLCFFQDSIAKVCGDDRARVIYQFSPENGKVPVYELAVDGKRVIVAHPGVGAPLAAYLFESLIALGCRKFIACGGAGVLDGGIVVGHAVVPTAAIRDEGTSYHYLPASREVQASPEAVAAIERTLKQNGVPYLLGKTWTTDAIYRETPAKIARRKQEGCLTVEMEAAAFFAVAQFRGVTFGQILYGGDDVSSETWDRRNWDNHTTARDSLFSLSIEACLSL